MAIALVVGGGLTVKKACKSRMVCAREHVAPDES